MAYSAPSVEVTQTLANPGGAAAITPDLNAVIVGPLYNVIRADLSDVVDATRSLVTSNFNWQTRFAGTGNVGYSSITLPNHIAGQRLDVQSLDVALSNVYARINEFKVDLSTFVGQSNPSLRSTVTMKSTTNSPKFALTNLAPDAKTYLQNGDRIVYTAALSAGGTQTFTTTVRSFGAVAGTVTLSNAVS